MPLQKSMMYLLLSLLANIALGQADQNYSIKRIQQDFRIMRGALEESHAGIYWYRTKFEMDSAFNDAYRSLDHEMTELDFFRIIAPLISKIGCGHTWIAATEATQQRIWEIGGVLPLKLKFLDRRAYCIQNNSRDSTSIQPGDEILSINQYSIDSLLRLSNKFSPGDGFIEVGKWRILDNVFNQFFTLYLGQPDEYRISVKRGNGEVDEITIKPLNIKDIESISQRRYSEVKEPDERNIKLSFLENESGAVLRIKEFADWRNGRGKVLFKDVLEKCFQRIDSSRSQSLIIDLRDNDGGNEKYGLLLFSYLIGKPFIGYKQIDFRTTDFSFRKYSQTGAFEYKLSKMLLKHKKANDSTYLLTNDKATSMQEPGKNPFKGDLYVLINRGSFSTTSDLAALIHFNSLGTFIGEETGGSYLGNTSNYSFILTLPNTKIKLNIPVARYQTNVTLYNDFGRGIIPDHAIQYSIGEILLGIDKEMEAVSALINR